LAPQKNFGLATLRLVTTFI